MSSLDDVSAKALVLIYEHAATQPEVAAQLGLDESQIKTVVAKALVHLGALLSPAPPVR